MNNDNDHSNQDGKIRPAASAEIQKLSLITKVSQRALQEAHARGLLFFTKANRTPVYVVGDVTNTILGACRLDGKDFKGQAKGCKTMLFFDNVVPGWPVGIVEASDYPVIALVEGVPDFLAAFQICELEGMLDRVAPVTIHSTYPPIYFEALPRFRGKRVIIFARADSDGPKAAAMWAMQLQPYAASVQVIDFSDFSQPGNKSLHEMKDAHAANYKLNPEEWRLLPAPKTASTGEEWKYAI